MNLQVGVKVLIKNNNDEYLFIQRADKMDGETEPHWDIPGGRIHPEEALMDALKREVAEETGLDLVGEPVLIAAQDIFVPAKELHVVRLTYTVEGSGAIALSDEHEKHIWWSKETAHTKNIDSYIKEIL